MGLPVGRVALVSEAMPSPLLLVGLLGLGWMLQSRLRRALRRRTSLPAVRACKVVQRGQSLKPHGLDEISLMSFNVLADQVGARRRGTRAGSRAKGRTLGCIS